MLRDSPTKDLGWPPHRHPHPKTPADPAPDGTKVEEKAEPTPHPDDHGTETQDNVSEQEAQRLQDELDKKSGITKSKGKKSKKEIRKEKKLNKLYNKRKKLKGEGGDVEGGDRVDRKYRRIQNKINRLHDSKVRHRKNIFTGGKYKKVVKK